MSKEEKMKEKRKEVLLKSKGSSGEPIVTEEDYKLSLSIALSWYNAHETIKQKRDWVSCYLISANRQDQEKSIKKLSDYHFEQLGSVCRIIMVGGYISERDQTWVEKKLAYLNSISMNIVSQADAPKEIKASQREKYLDFCIEIDDMIDDFVEKKKTNFSMKSFIAKNNISTNEASKISKYYKPNLAEIEETIQEECEQLNEGYSHFSKSELKRHREVLLDICSSHLQLKAAKAPRVRKQKPASVLVKNVVILKEYPDLALTSVDTKGIIGSRELWLYNTVSRVLYTYVSLDSTGMSVKGRYLKNYDVDKSSCKKIRKPEEFFKNIVLAKKTMMESYTKLTTNAVGVNGKIYPAAILLKVF